MLTLLFTDVVDSTQLNDRLGDAAMATLWTGHDRRARALIARWRGREVGRSDGFLVLFDCVGDALGFALDYHRALAALDVPLAARVGLHTGPAQLRENSADDRARGATPFEVDGLALPLAARVMSAAGGGQTLLSAASVTALGAGDWVLRSQGHWRLKGVAEPVELFQAGDAATVFAPPPDSAKAYRVVRQGGLWLPARELPHTLPAERDAFVGREAALQALDERLERGARLVSLLGIGGIGKTRLALRFAWTRLGDYRGGSFFCDLSPARSEAGVLQAVAQGMAVPLSGADPVEQLARAIAGRGECLLLLDNAEQVRDEVARLVGRWLDAAPQARAVLTTRALLGLPGEQVLEVEPLPANDSAALFLRRAEAASAGFNPGAEDRAAVAPLVQLLDGLPLAIELAAARVRVLPPRLLLQRMGDRFRLLAAGGARPDRQATLRGTFDWSWELLNAAEQAALAQLSVFEGGFTTDAAEAVLDLADCGGGWVLDAVQGLVDKSLVRRVGDTRLTLLGSVQVYAAEHLATSGRFHGSGPAAQASARARHWRHFAALDEAAAVVGGGVEIDNLVAACQRAAAAGDGAIAAGALVGAWAVLRLTGPFRFALQLAASVEVLPPLAPTDRAAVHWVAGSALAQLGEPAAARRRYEAGLALPAVGAGWRARLHCALGELLTDGGDADAAACELQSALDGAREHSDALLECRVLNGQGALAGDQGRLDDAARCYDAALALARRLGDRRWEGGVLGNLGWLMYVQGQPDAARERYEQALAMALQTGDRRWEGNARCNLGLLHHEAGRAALAREHFDAALSMARTMGHARLQATVLCNLGLVAEGEGDLAQAARLQAQAVDLAHAIGDRRAEAGFRGDLARLQALLGQRDEARACFDAAHELLEALADRRGLALLACRRAEAEAVLGTPAAAADALAHAAAQAAALAGDAEIGRALAQARERVGAAVSRG